MLSSTCARRVSFTIIVTVMPSALAILAAMMCLHCRAVRSINRKEGKGKLSVFVVGGGVFGIYVFLMLKPRVSKVLLAFCQHVCDINLY